MTARSAAWRHHLTMIYIATKNWDALARLIRDGLPTPLSGTPSEDIR